MCSRRILIGLTFLKFFFKTKGDKKELSRGSRGEFAYSKICVLEFACKIVTQKMKKKKKKRKEKQSLKLNVVIIDYNIVVLSF